MIPTNKKIAVLHPYANKVGGAVKMMLYVSDVLQQENNDVTFYTLYFNRDLFLNENISFRIENHQTPKILRFFAFISIAFKIRKCDYIIIGNSPMHFVGVLSKILFFSQAKLIWWNHHIPWYYGNNTSLFIELKRYIEKCCIKKIDRILANSQYLKSIIDSIRSIDAQILFPVLGKEFEAGIDTTHIKKKNIIFTYGRWVEGKNLQAVFDVYQALQSQIIDLRLIIGGNGKQQEEFQALYKNDARVEFLGHLDVFQIQENLKQAKIFVFPSTIDSFGITKIEALSLGVPVVCFKNHDFEEIVQDGVNGFCVKTQEQFISAVSDILTNPILEQTLSLNAQLTIQKFTSTYFKQHLEDIFCF